MVFYRPGEEHGLAGNPFNSLVTPRPIGWISTRSRSGVDNLAPYSFFNAVAYSPPQVMFASTSTHQHGGGRKDSARNAQETGEFVVNVASWAQREAVNASSIAAPPDVDEFAHVGLERLPSNVVMPSRVAGSPAHLECVLTQVVQLPSEDGDDNAVVFGRVVGIHIDHAVLVDGRVDINRVAPIGRLGGTQYVVVREPFSMTRPEWR